MFLHPLGLLALLGVPAVLGLHLFRRRFRRHPVSAIFLWETEDRVAVAGRRRTPLRHSPSLWAELCAALLLALAFAGPRSCGAGEAQHLVAVLDGSASMSARAAEGSAADEARRLLEERIARLPRGSRVTVVQSGPRPLVLAGPAAFSEEARAALADYRPGHARHDLHPAVGLAQKIAAGGAVVLLTDHFRPDSWPESVELVSVAGSQDNVAITHATRRTSAVVGSAGRKQERVHLSVTSFARAPVRVPVRIDAGGVLVDQKTIELAPGERRHLSFVLDEPAPMLRASLPADGLELDNVAWLAPPPERTVAVGSTLPPSLGRFLGLQESRSDPSPVGRWLTLVPDTVAATSPARADVVLSESVTPGEGWCASFERAGDERQHLVGPFLVDQGHPLLEGVRLDGVIWSRSPAVSLSGAPLVSAGNTPLITEEHEAGRRAFRFDIDLEKSTLHRSPDWPILLANLVEMRRRELPGPLRTSLGVGEPFVYREAGEHEYRLTDAKGSTVVRARGILVIDDVDHPGAFSLESEPAGRMLCQVGYSFVDPAESDLRGRARGERPGTASRATLRAGFTWIELLLIAAVLACLGVDWWVLRPGRAAGVAGARGELR